MSTRNLETIYGLHAVRSMLTRHPERVRSVRLAQGRDDPRAREIEELARKSGRTVQRIDARSLAQTLGDVAHQGVVAEIEPLRAWTEDDLVTALETRDSIRSSWCSMACRIRTTSAPACAPPMPAGRSPW